LIRDRIISGFVARRTHLARPPTPIAAFGGSETFFSHMASSKPVTTRQPTQMLDLLTSPEAWASLLTLSVLEIVLGIDNVIFLSIISSRLPEGQQKLARRIGLGLALLARIALLFSIVWIIGLTRPIVTLMELQFSWRDLILIGGGTFLLYKATTEIHLALEGEDEHGAPEARQAGFANVITQIVLLDIVFSLDSVLTAIGMTDQLPIMITAVVIAITIMLLAAEPLSAFVNRHKTVKMLALSFLLLIGVALIADGLHFHIPRGYLYFAIAFSILVETLNLLAARRARKRKASSGAAGE